MTLVEASPGGQRPYFGYGSNLHAADFARWCASRGHDASGLRVIGSAWLPDHEPVFHYRSAARGGGALSVRARLGAAVPGVLFETDEASRAALDQKEGVPNFYRRVEVTALDALGDEVPAFTYEVVPGRREAGLVPPTSAYLSVVREALAHFGLPEEPVVFAARSHPPRPAIDAVFVYGTLRRGECRAPLLAARSPRAWSSGTIEGRLLHLGGYPGWLPEPGAGRVRGEWVQLPVLEEALLELDEVEDFLGYGAVGSMYRRVLVAVRLDSGGLAHAWTYRYLGERAGRPTLVSGDWRAP